MSVLDPPSITVQAVEDDRAAVEVVRELIEDAVGPVDAGIAPPRVYADPAFHDVVSEMAGGTICRIFATIDGNVVGSLTWMERELDPALVGAGPRRLLNALPWFGSHGGPLIDGTLPEEWAWDVAHALVGAMGEAADAPDVLAATLITSPNDDPEFVEALESSFEPAAIDWRRSQITSLPIASRESDERIGERLLMETFGQKTRNLVRKGLKEGFTVHRRDDDAAWRALESLHAAGMAAIGGPIKPPAHFAALRASRIHGGDLWVAEDGGTIVAALLLLRKLGRIEYLIPAADAAHRSRQPMAAIIHRAMVDAVSRHDLDWSWGGTPMGHDSLHRFKAGFGGVDAPYAIMCRPGPGGVERLRGIGAARLAEAAPWWYAYPFAALEAEPPPGDAADARNGAEAPNGAGGTT